ncbi:MAG: hypothetical protein LBP26_07210 [Clostridiales bacterium]|jgi:V/A-type H+-transporting ATPase subunit E|nr:hypothetical protein [Clostridiales bacterium]
MNGKEAIIKNIIDAAESAAAAVVRAAEAESAQTLAKGREDAAAKRGAELERERERAALFVERGAAAAVLEKSKTVLAAKQRLLSLVYAEAVAKILNMSDNLYREFIGGMLAKYAQNGDEVKIAERDAKRLTPEWLAAAAKKAGVSLTLSPNYHTGGGGVILTGKNSDRNMTLKTLAELVRPETEAGAAKKLFG